MLVGSATRFISGRNAIQTVYWRTKQDGNVTRLIRNNRTCTFNNKYPKGIFRPIQMKFHKAQ